MLKADCELRLESFCGKIKSCKQNSELPLNASNQAQVQHDMESYRNIHKTPCHSEFSSESDQSEICLKSKRPKTLNQVRNDMKNVAFTLAETLITIGMIGVIAALTLPTLMKSTNDKEVIARVLKTRAMLNEALGRAVAKYGSVDTWFQSVDSTVALKAQRIGKRVTEFMQVEKICDTGAGCFASGNINTLSGEQKGWGIVDNNYLLCNAF